MYKSLTGNKFIEKNQEGQGKYGVLWWYGEVEREQTLELACPEVESY